MHLPTKLQKIPKSAHQRWNDPLAHWPHSPFKHTLLTEPFITWKMNASELIEIPQSRAASIHPCSCGPHYKTRRICLHKSNPVSRSSRSWLNSKTTKWCIHDRRSVLQHQSKYCYHNQLGNYQKVHKCNEMQPKQKGISICIHPARTNGQYTFVCMTICKLFDDLYCITKLVWEQWPIETSLESKLTHQEQLFAIGSNKTFNNTLTHLHNKIHNKKQMLSTTNTRNLHKSTLIKPSLIG